MGGPSWISCGSGYSMRPKGRASPLHELWPRTKKIVQAVRMFLRFLIATGQCAPGLEHALPTIAHWRLASLPKYLPTETVEHVLASCDRATPIAGHAIGPCSCSWHA